MVAGAIGIATFSQHLFGWNLGIDQLLFVEPPGAAATASPRRMRPPASACFTLASIALVLLHGGRPVSIARRQLLWRRWGGASRSMPRSVKRRVPNKPPSSLPRSS